MKRRGNKLLHILLIWVMVLGFSAGMGAPVLADETGASETLDLYKMESTQSDAEGYLIPTKDIVTVGGYNVKAEGHAWDSGGWPVGRVGNILYNGLTFTALRGKIVKVVLRIAEPGDNWQGISASGEGAITTVIDYQTETFETTYINNAGVDSVTFRYTPSAEDEKDDFFQFQSATVYYGTSTSYTVEVTQGQNMTKTAESGEAKQTNLSGPMTAVIYRADDGYIFPTVSDCYKTVFGITVERISDTEVRVSGTPIVDTCVTIPDAVQKTNAISAFSLNLNSVPMPVNGLQELIATVEPYNVADKTVKWSVSGDAVKLYADSTCRTEVGGEATDLRTVYAKGISEGKATVTVTSNLDGQGLPAAR